MKALILSCNTGGGHNSAARAIAEEMQERGDEAYVLLSFRSFIHSHLFW